MFKTIEECRLELVSYTLTADVTISKDMTDFLPVSAARASFGNEDKTGQNEAADIKLMNYLAEHQHMTPFEYQHATFLIECPLFIRSQIHRHRTFAYNEISRRYTSEDLEFWIPDKFRGQAKNNKQASSGEAALEYEEGLEKWKEECYQALADYNYYVGMGVAREIARAQLPQSLLTRFYMGGTLRNWQHFIELRRDEHAQHEVQVVANKIADQLKALWPRSCDALGI